MIKAVSGELRPSNHSGVERHGFGPGVYAFDSTNETWLNALSFAIDRCWPMPNYEEGGSGFGGEHNPCLVFFKQQQMNRTYMDSTVYLVGEKSPFKENDLKHVYLVEGETKNRYREYVASRGKWKEKKNTDLYYWKEFVKLARCYNVIPRGKSRFSGYLHRCDTTHLTDKCNEPMVDPDRWIQHCFPYPNVDITEERVFVEFDVSWNLWLHKDDRGTDAEESAKGKKRLENAIPVKKPINEKRRQK